jgi:Protein of unknown function (DUF2799)
MKKITWVLLALSVLGSGCTTMSKKDCMQANWTHLGIEDGKDGETLDTFKDRETQCAENGGPADRHAYLTGYANGIKLYCTKRSGELLGRKNGYYKSQCPQDLESEFLDGYRLGKAQYDQEQLQHQLDDQKKQLEEQRKQMEEQRKQMEDQQEQTRRQMEEQRQQLEDLQRQQRH